MVRSAILLSCLCSLAACIPDDDAGHGGSASGMPGISSMGFDDTVLFIEIPESARPLLVDTGAPVTLLSSRINTWRQVFVPIPDPCPRLSIGQVTFTDYWCAQGDLGSLAGILGVEVFSRYATLFDYRTRAIGFETDTTEPVSSTTELSFTLEGGGTLTGEREYPATRLMLDGTIDGVTVRLLLDTGAAGIFLREDLFAQIVADGRRTRSYTLGTALGNQESEVSRARSAVVAGLEVPGPLIGVLPPQFANAVAGELGRFDGVLGVSFLAHFAVRIDYPRSLLTLSRYASADHVQDPFHAIGARIDATGQITELFDGTDAETKLAVGETVLRIDGVELSTARAVGPALRGPVGAIKQLDLADGRTVQIAVEELLPL